MHRLLVFTFITLWLSSCSLATQKDMQSAGLDKAPQGGDLEATDRPEDMDPADPYGYPYPGDADDLYFYDPYDSYCCGNPYYYDPYWGDPYFYDPYYGAYYPDYFYDDDFTDCLEDLYEDRDLKDALEEIAEARREFWEELFEEIGEWVEDRRDRRKQRREDLRDRVADGIDRRRDRRQELIHQLSDLFDGFPDGALLFKRRSSRRLLTALPDRKRLTRHQPPRGLRPSRPPPRIRISRGGREFFGHRPAPFARGFRRRR